MIGTQPSTRPPLLSSYVVLVLKITLICKTWLSRFLWQRFLFVLLLFGHVFGSPELKFVDECCLWLKVTAAARSANVEH